MYGRWIAGYAQGAGAVEKSKNKARRLLFA